MRMTTIVLIVLGIAATAAAQTTGLPLPSIGLPLPQIGLPLPSTGLPPAKTTPQPAAPPASRAGDQRTGRAHPARGASTVVYVVPAFGWPYSGAALPEPPAVAAPIPAPPPPQHPADEPQADASASPDHSLGGVPPAVPLPSAPVPPATIYVIPGCYVGNVPPREVRLPSGCDPGRATVFPSSGR